MPKKKQVALAVVSEKEVIDPVKNPKKEKGKYTLLSSWIDDTVVLQMLQRTPPAHVFTRKGKGGGDFQYVTGTYIKKALNYTFGWNWDFEIVKQEIMQGTGWGQIVTTGKLTVRGPKGQAIVKMQNGKADIKYKSGTNVPMDIGNDFKASATDALKKCASELGIASDIYGKNEFKDIGRKVQESPTVQYQEDAPSPADVYFDKAMNLIDSATNKAVLSKLNAQVLESKNLTDQQKSTLVDLICAKEETIKK